MAFETETIEINIEMREISGGHIENEPSFFIWFYNTKTDITILLIHNNTYWVTTIMILRCPDANIVENRNRWWPFCFRDNPAMALYLKIFVLSSPFNNI